MHVYASRVKSRPGKTPWSTIPLALAFVASFLALFHRDPAAPGANSLANWEPRPGAFESLLPAPGHVNPMLLLSSLVAAPSPPVYGFLVVFVLLAGFAVEGRLGTGKFLLLYASCSALGVVVQLLGHLSVPGTFAFGATAGVCGLAAAAIRMFPFAPVLYRGWTLLSWDRIEFNLPLWVVSSLFVVGVTGASVFTGSTAGIALLTSFAGTLGGFGLTYLFGTKTESFAESQARAGLDESTDVTALTRHEIEDLARANPESIEYTMAWLGRALETGGPPSDALAQFSRLLPRAVRSADPDQLSFVLTRLAGIPGAVPAEHLLDAGLRLEREGRPIPAAALFETAASDQDGSDEIQQSATFHLALLRETWLHDAVGALGLYREHMAKWPTSPFEPQVRERIDFLNRI